MLTHHVSLSLHLGKNFLDLRILVSDGLSVDESVGSHPREDLLFVLGIHLDATNGKIFNLGKEIVVGLLHLTFIGFVSVKELHVQSSCLSLFALPPLHDRFIIGVSEGDGRFVGPNELELAGFVLFEQLLGEGGLGFWDSLIIIGDISGDSFLLGRSDGNDSGESE